MNAGIAVYSCHAVTIFSYCGFKKCLQCTPIFVYFLAQFSSGSLESQVTWPVLGWQTSKEDWGHYTEEGNGKPPLLASCLECPLGLGSPCVSSNSAIPFSFCISVPWSCILFFFNSAFFVCFSCPRIFLEKHNLFQ